MSVSMYEGVGLVALQSDTKPLNVKNGAKLLEMDTGKEYRFDKDNLTWIEQTGEGSSDPGNISYRGTVSTASELPESGVQVGDAYLVEDESNVKYVWDGEDWVLWEKIATNAQIDAIFS